MRFVQGQSMALDEHLTLDSSENLREFPCIQLSTGVDVFETRAPLHTLKIRANCKLAISTKPGRNSRNRGDLQ